MFTTVFFSWQCQVIRLKYSFSSNSIKQKLLCVVLRLLYNYLHAFTIHYHGKMNLCNQHLFRHGVLSNTWVVNVTKLNKSISYICLCNRKDTWEVNFILFLILNVNQLWSPSNNWFREGWQLVRIARASKVLLVQNLSTGVLGLRNTDVWQEIQ